MDISNRYVLMCQKAQEIQEHWMPRQCDFIIQLSDLEEGIGLCHPASHIVQVANFYYEEQDEENYARECDEMKEQSLWLPRQDQLQRMIEPDISLIHSIIRRVVEKTYHDYSRNIVVSAPELFYSMEQLWLAYIMSEKFGKVWNEEEWVEGS